MTYVFGGHHFKSCSIQCNPENTRLQNDLLSIMWDIIPYSARLLSPIFQL